MATIHYDPLPETLAGLQQEIESVARGYGLDFFPTIFELVDAEQLTAIAALLARAFLRLTKHAPIVPTSRMREQQKELDDLHGESVHVNDESDHEGPPWRAA